MKIVFLSNYYNHHQSALARRLQRLSEGWFSFIKTTEIGAERVALGWKTDEPEYVVSYASDPERAQAAIEDADIVIYGAAPVELIRSRVKAGLPVFKYSERIFKNARTRITLPLRVFKYRRDYGRCGNVFLLCASAYAAADYAKTLAFRNKAYKWGYFPETILYEKDLWRKKEPRSILWAGRFIEWKHPEAPVLLAERLMRAGENFTMKMVGRGEMLQRIQIMAERRGVSGKIKFLGAMPPSEVRAEMEKASIFIATSDFNEGWGAVVGEAMNSGCAVVASHAMGSAPFLIEHGKNGRLYKNGDIAGLERHVTEFLVDERAAAETGKNAYDAIVSEWNADVAADRIVAFGEALLSGNTLPVYDSGPLSEAPVLSNRYKYEK